MSGTLPTNLGQSGYWVPGRQADGSMDGWSGTAPTSNRPFGVWLPGLKRVAKLLNGTAGVARVASSKVHRVAVPSGDDVAEADAGADAGADDGPSKQELVIRFDGKGNHGAHRLRASFFSRRGCRTQELYVNCEDTFSLSELGEVLRALQPVLDFKLEEDVIPSP